MGALPAAGQWVKLQVPASAVGIEGSALNGHGLHRLRRPGHLGCHRTLEQQHRHQYRRALTEHRLCPHRRDLSWPSTAGKVYQVSYKNKLSDPTWNFAAQLTATASTTTWVDKGVTSSTQRFYQVMQTN